MNFLMIYRICCAIARLHAAVSSHHFDAFLMPQAMAEIPHCFERDSPRTLQRVVCKSADMSGNQTQRARLVKKFTGLVSSCDPWHDGVCQIAI